MDLLEKGRRVRLLIMDCDGVLTDGRLYFSATGEELKVFHVRDGQGLATWHRAGFRSAIISGRDSPIVELRGRQLGVEFIIQNCHDKVAAFNEILVAAGVTAEQTAFIGDDTPDVEVMRLAGLSIAVSDANGDARSVADHVTSARGGHGAVREMIDLLLAAQHV
jgi:3-deoxy-D-manno-octulosonate 8-phosphate phosphatase (KDO 8-P phosphatase)